MPCARRDLLALAEYLLNLKAEPGQDNEPLLRAAASRAYYAVYHLADEIRASVDPKRGTYAAGEGKHQALFEDLNRYAASISDTSTRQIFYAAVRNMDALRIRRVHADYHLHRPLTQNAVRISCDLARTVTRQMEKHLS